MTRKATNAKSQKQILFGYTTDHTYGLVKCEGTKGSSGSRLQVKHLSGSIAFFVSWVKDVSYEDAPCNPLPSDGWCYTLGHLARYYSVDRWRLARYHSDTKFKVFLEMCNVAVGQRLRESAYCLEFP